MQISITNVNGDRSRLGVVSTTIPSDNPTILGVYELSHPVNNTQLSVKLLTIGFLNNDSDTDVGVVKFKYGDRTVITLTFDLDDHEDCRIFDTIRSYKIISTIYIPDTGRNETIRTLIVIPHPSVAIAR